MLPESVEINGVQYQIILYDPSDYPKCQPLRDGETFIGRMFAHPDKDIPERGEIYLPQTIPPVERRAELDATIEDIAAHAAKCRAARVA